MTNSETLEQIGKIFYKYCSFGCSGGYDKELDNARFAKV